MPVIMSRKSILTLSASVLMFTSVSWAMIAWPGSPDLEMIVADAAAASDAAREALLQGQEVSVVRHDGDPEGAQVGLEALGGLPVARIAKYSGRTLLEEDLDRVDRFLGRLATLAEKPWEIDGKPESEQERIMAQKLKDRAMLEAVRRAVANHQCFMAPHLIPDLRSDERWHYWNADIYKRVDGKRVCEVLYVPIDLSVNAELKARIKRLSAIQDYRRTEIAFEWNSKPYEKRRELVDAAASARVEHAILLKALQEGNGSVDVRRRVADAEAIIQSVPFGLNPLTLELPF